MCAFPVPIHAYGVVLALAFVAGIVMGVVNGRRIGLGTDQMLDLAVWFLVSAMVGARVLYIVLYPAQFPTVRSWFALSQGGLVFFGGFLATAATMIAYGKWHRIRLRDLGDMIAPCLILGHAVGRIGCFLNGCCYGRPTGLPWGVVFPRLGDGLPRHPTQLYEAGFLAVLFLVAQHLFRVRTAEDPLAMRDTDGSPRHPWRQGGSPSDLLPVGPATPGTAVGAASEPVSGVGVGQASEPVPGEGVGAFPADGGGHERGGWLFPGAVWGGYTLMYSGFRFAIEYLRGDDRGGFFTAAGLSVSQGIGLAGIAASLVWLYLCHRKACQERETGGNR
ncbi:MAG: prolipoprotein diacylglyceryl transferase [Candidatus Riflebacteria bacterium]|nr:prolipoprotein diacylglyceryl transferase [Candidatus Riflebacteria bacterium]